MYSTHLFGDFLRPGPLYVASTDNRSDQLVVDLSIGGIRVPFRERE